MSVTVLGREFQVAGAEQWNASLANAVLANGSDNNDYSVQNDKSLHGHCTNERRVRKWDKKVRRDVI